MKPPKCRACGVEEWGHTCSGQLVRKPRNQGKTTKPEYYVVKHQNVGISSELPKVHTREVPVKEARSQEVKASDFDSDIAGSTPTGTAKLTGYQRLKSWRAKHPDKAREVNRNYMKLYRQRLKDK